MLNVNINKIAQARSALSQQFNEVVATIENYFNDESNFLKSEVGLSVILAESNYKRLLPMLAEVGLHSRPNPQVDSYTVYFPDDLVLSTPVESVPTPPVVQETVSTPVNQNVFVPPVENVFQPTVDPIFDQEPVVTEQHIIAEIKDSLQKPVVTSNNTQNLFVMPEDHLTYNDSPF